MINGVLKDFSPIWIDSDVDIENDPYTSDCIDPTNTTNPHAYTHFIISNGVMTSQNCIKKPPGNKELYYTFYQIAMRLFHTQKIVIKRSY